MEQNVAACSHPRVRVSQPTFDCVDLNLWFRNAALGLFADTLISLLPLD
ncbi:MAG: hypothetical protein RIT15_1332 [Pseudomonadota bacterium]|jgi:hypothetical protein